MQRYFAYGKRDNKIILFDSDMHHIKNVMRMNSDTLIECVWNEDVYICCVGDVLVNEFEIIDKRCENNELDCEVMVAIGLVKEQKMDLILQKLTELGVSRIIPVKMERSIVKLDDKRTRKKLERWRSICKEASEQSKRNCVPIVDEVKTIRELSDYECDFKAVCSVSNQENLVNKYLQSDIKYAKMLFVIGPEGGISAMEEETLNKMGFVSVSLGSRVMRVETAAIYVASILNFCCVG